MAMDEWRDFDAWPPRTMKPQTWYVDCADKANGSAGSGTLAVTMTDGKKSDQFVFNPDDPVPTTGGAATSRRERVGRPSREGFCLSAHRLPENRWWSTRIPPSAPHAVGRRSTRYCWSMPALGASPMSSSSCARPDELMSPRERTTGMCCLIKRSVSS